jgi:hypothetical protein
MRVKISITPDIINEADRQYKMTLCLQFRGFTCQWRELPVKLFTERFFRDFGSSFIDRPVIS